MDILRDEAALRAGDPSGILEAFLSLPVQVAESYLRWEMDPPPPLPRSVTLCGMGGSAAAGDVVRAAYGEGLAVPVSTVRGSRLPGHLGPEDLVVCLSFSGNTEETLEAFDLAVSRGCRVGAVCSGGRLAQRAEAVGSGAVYGIPKDVPMPRAGLGHLTAALLGVLGQSGVLPWPDDDVEEVRSSLGALAEELGPGRPNEAKDLAAWMGDRAPVVWGSEGPSAAAAWRWKCAFNENAKIPAFASSLPELDHHEVAGWAAGQGEGFALIVLRESGEHPGTARRLEATLDAIGASGLPVLEVRARGSSALARTLSLMLIGDVASTYHALARGVDPTPIVAIERLKERLSGGDASPLAEGR